MSPESPNVPGPGPGSSAEHVRREQRTVHVGGAELTVATFSPETISGGAVNRSDAVPVVLLHDGLGSITQWRSVPAHLAAATGRQVIAYDRPGHGTSTPVPTGAWPADWLHREADRLAALLDALELGPTHLVGHSDGGSIAALHAVAAAGTAGVASLTMLAAHAFVEPVCVDAIAAMRTSPAPVIAGLARAHAHPAEVFEAWSGVWVSDEFARWDVRTQLGCITCPTLVVQGTADEYATDEQATSTAAAIGENARCDLLDGMRHLLHHQDADRVVALLADWLAELD